MEVGGLLFGVGFERVIVEDGRMRCSDAAEKGEEVEFVAATYLAASGRGLPVSGRAAYRGRGCTLSPPLPRLPAFALDMENKHVPALIVSTQHLMYV